MDNCFGIRSDRKLKTVVRGRRTVRLGALTAGLLVIATVFAVLWIGVLAGTFLLLATAAALGTMWSWFDEGRPLRFWVLASVLLALATVVGMASVGIANIT